MNKNSRTRVFGGVVWSSAVADHCPHKRLSVGKAAMLAAAFGVISLGVIGRVAAESPPGCTDSAISASLNPSPSGTVHHGDKICYSVCYGATGTPNPCDVADFSATLFFPNGVSKLVTSGATIGAGNFFCCPSADPRCNPLLTAADYCYIVDHADEVLSFSGCPPLTKAGIGKVVAHTTGTGQSQTPGVDEVAPCATANNSVRHACCEPCSGTCTEVSSAKACPFPRVFTPDKHCSEVTCTPRVCLGPRPPCEAGQECSLETGQCVDLSDPPLSTFCETDQNLCTPEHCNGEGACVPNGPPVSCPGPVPPCEAGQVCNPANGHCEDRPDAVLSTPCEADGNLCTIDHCNGQGECVLLRSKCDDPDFCNDGNVCTRDICDVGLENCCRHADIPCPPRPCQRIVGCDPIDGCQYEFDCREGTDCCPDDNNLCTHEFCDQDSGLCGSTADCRVDADCNDGLNCTVDFCRNSCCGHEPLCREEEGECFKQAPCSGPEICTRADGCGGACFFTAAGPTRCFAGEFNCDQPACTSDADCPAGSACSSTCCGLQCAPLCGNPFPQGGTANQETGSSNENTAGGPVRPPICCADGAVCDDLNACTDDACEDGCCAYTPHECPPRECHRFAGCDPVLGCRYVLDCREPGVNCCPDDGDPCTHEFCNADTGLCGKTTDCVTNADCDDRNACTDETCVEGCCERGPHDCPPRNCFAVSCDVELGCVYTPDCRAGTDCCPDDGNRCTHESCDPNTGLCGSRSDCDTAADCEQNPPDLCIVDSCVEHCCTALTLCPPPAGACCANDPDVCQDGLACTVDTCDAPGCCNQRPLCPPGATCCADGASCDDGNSCTADRCGTDGCCVSTPLCTTAADCDDHNTCTTDSCGSNGCCEHVDIECPRRPCFTLVGCDPSRGCEYAPVVCDDPICQSCNPDSGVCEDNGRCGIETCRTPGFWATHACGATGVPERNLCERKKGARNVTQAALDECGGCVEVCGDIIDNTVLNDSDSTLEAMCINGGGVRQLARHLTAAALNCCISGGDPIGTCGGISVQDLFVECNAACAAGSTTGAVTGVDCIGAIDCYNNGGHYIGGSCVHTDDNCHNRNLGICTGGSICTEVNPCPLGEKCGPTDAAGSSNACNTAKFNACYVIGTSTCGTGGPNGPESCP